MATFIFYLLKSSICLLVFYIFYRILLSKETYFSLNRYFIISSVILSFLIPIIYITIDFPASNFNNSILLDTVVITPKGFHEVYMGNFDLFNILLYIYFAGAAILLVHYALKITQLVRLIKRYGITYKNGIRYVFNDAQYAPFSFFNFLFLDTKLAENDAEKIIAHEQIHVKQYHSFDIIIMELLTIFHWFNPFIWLYKHSLKENHEFLADEGVLLKGYEKVNYQHLLLSISTGIPLNDLSNNFNNSIIKRRFIMMSKVKSSMAGKLKILLAIPFLVALFWLFSCDKIVKTQDEKKSNEVITSADKNAKDSVYTKVEVLPEFKGGYDNLIKFLVNNVKYPANAKEKGIQGKVYIEFTIDENGKVINPNIGRGVNPELDAEALRVVSLLPDWIPGKDKGKAVKVKSVLPINFKLS